MKNNDYGFLIDRIGSRGTAAAEPVSVIMPTYDRCQQLARTLAAMIHQTYPHSLLEIVVADDGSSDGTADVIRKYEDRLDLVHVRRPHRGHGLAATCNLGLRAARHDRVVLLQSDMIPHPGLIASYARFFPVIDAAVLIGHRRFVSADGLSDEEIACDPSFVERLTPVETANPMWRDAPRQRREDWRLELYARTDRLKQELWPFRAVVGSNLAFHRSLVATIGGFCESFTAWGCEDGEFGYRAYNAGFYFMPVLEACAYHQEPAMNDCQADRVEGFQITKEVRAELCPVPPFRPPRSEGPFRVPKVSLCLHLGEAWDAAARLERFLRERPLRRLDLELVVISCQQLAAVEALARVQEIDVHWLPALGDQPWEEANRAVRASRGAYICHSDLGAQLSPVQIASLADALDQQNVGCVRSTSPDQPTHATACMYRKRDWSRLRGFDARFSSFNPAAIRQALESVCLLAALELAAAP